MNHDRIKISCITSAEITTPPILWRRRLSAPETLMRRHLLSQQRSLSQDSCKSDSTDSQTQRGSVPNLVAKRRNQEDIRKSTLMKRFWSNSNANSNKQANNIFPSSYSEWQFSVDGRRRSSPEHRNRKPSRRMPTPKSEEDSYVIYSSNLTESTDNTSRTEVSDSYPMSTETQSETNNNRVRASETKAYRIGDDGISDLTDRTQLPSDLPIKYQFVMNENGNERVAMKERSKTNLNVITNVQLSQSTLNMIFNQVMQDVHQKPPHQEPERTQDGNHLMKQKAYNFKFNVDDDHRTSSLLSSSPRSSPKKMISVVNAGSPYKTRTSLSPSVPRLSAMPRTSSMEVNISSNDSLDKDSDNSLVDSLEASPARMKVQRNVVKESTSQIQVDDQMEHSQKKSVKKSSVFYIPIDDVDSPDSQQVVSDLLPNKLKEKLIKRQMKREEKRLQERMKAFDVENGNNVFSTSPDDESSSTTMARKAKRNSSNNSTKSKITTLPQIDLKKDYDKSLRSTYTQRSLNKYRESVDKTKSSLWLPKTRTTKQSTSKHIEILEIMEIVEPDRAIHLTPKSKSRIPVFQQQSTKLPKLKTTPTFLDFDTMDRIDPKLDQLIANILIDSLNHDPGPVQEQLREANANTCTEFMVETEKASVIERAADLLTKQVLDNNNAEDETRAADGEEMPKGWITFYMLQQKNNQSPDSNTSDEGYTKTKTATKSTQYVMDEVQDRGLSDDSNRKLIRRKSKNPPDGWSVSFTRNHHHSEPVPEVEMKFKFPQLMSKVTKHTSNQGLNFEEACNNNRSEMDKSKLYLKAPSSNRISTPRPTKTSRQRTLLNRPHRIPPHEEEVLSVNGSSLNRKLPRLINEQDLQHLLLNWSRQHK